MHNLFNQPDVSAILERFEKLTPSSERQWGKMNVAQMLAHCNKSMETAMGKNFIKRLFLGRIIAPLIKSKVLGENPFPKNSPTDKSYIFTGDLLFNEEKSKTIASLKKFFEGGASQCTVHPHPFFGKFTPDNGQSSNGNIWITTLDNSEFKLSEPAFLSLYILDYTIHHENPFIATPAA